MNSYDFDNMMGEYYIAPAFMDKILIHVAKNFMSLPNIKVRALEGHDLGMSSFLMATLPVFSWLRCPSECISVVLDWKFSDLVEFLCRFLSFSESGEERDKASPSRLSWCSPSSAFSQL